MEFVKNAWYVAGWASEFGEELKRVTILEEHIVMYRMSTGDVAAMEDLCPHRFLPLSMGERIGDDVRCGYHGMTFDCTGKCIRVPGRDKVLQGADLRAYPIHERHDIVWVWMGDPALADPDDVFDLPQFHDDAWEAHQGDLLHLKSNYLNVAENLVDPAHVSFVHPTSLGNAASEDVPVNADIKGNPIVAWRWIRNGPPIGFFKEFGNFSGNVDRWHYYYLYTPCTAVIDFGSVETERQLAEEDRSEGLQVFAIHLMTPVTSEYTIDRWMHLRNRSTNDDAVSEKLDGLFRGAFAEDKLVLEAIQEEENRNPTRRPVRFGIDRGPMKYRKSIERLIEKEKENNQAAE